MRNTLLLIFITVLQVHADDTYSQNTKLTLNLNNVTIANVLEEIQNNSEFYFLFNAKLIDVEREVSISMEDKKISEILNSLFSGTGVNYLVYDRQIILTPSDVISLSAAMQQLKITGTVTGKDGTPLPGVNVVVTGTTLGAITDIAGKYSIEVPQGSKSLTFSFVGMESQEITIGTLTQINVTMAESAIGLDEVVVIGYGTQRRIDVTGSISTASATELQDIRATNITEVLKGTLSGVTALQSHTPEGGAIIRIRGYGTINNNDPLWVVDGVPGMVEVNPNNIESITVLKDASAQAIYGARGANGVILVTTKLGKINQELQINVKVKRGISQTVKFYDCLNTPEYAEMLWLSAKNSGIENYSHPIFGNGASPDIPEYILPARGQNVDESLYDDMMVHEDGDDTFFITKANKEGTKWQDVITRDFAKYEEYNLDISGGTKTAEYSFMVDYLNQEGALEYTGYKRYNLSPNISFQPKKWLKIGEKTGISYSESSGDQSTNTRNAPMGYSFRMQPFIPVYDIAGNFAGSIVEGGGNVPNPMFAMYMNQWDMRKKLMVNGNTFANVTIAEGLSFKTLFGFNYGAMDNRDINYNEKATAERGMYDQLNEDDEFSLQWSWTNTAEYKKNFGGIHDLTFLAGTEAIKNQMRWRAAGIQDFFSRNPDYIQLNVGARTATASGNMSEWSLFSMFGRVNYELNNKYLFAITFRRDGSSRFGKDNRYGNFPSVSAGWKISEESFMASSKNWLDNLKLRTGWGQSGNDQIGNYNGFTTFSSRIASGYDNSYYPLTGLNVGTPTPGFQSATFGSSSVRWEVSTTTDIGIDATLVKNIDISVDIWRRKTDDMLFPKEIPVVAGIASVPSVNVGVMDNKGIDFSLGYRGNALNNDLIYGVALNISHFKNEILKLSGTEDEFLSGGIDWATVTRAKNGTAFPEFYGYIVEGIFQTDEEAANHPPAFGESGTYNEPGHFKYKDVNEDGVINSEDRTYMGSPHPKFTAGLNFNLNYKELTFSTRFYTSVGNKLFNAVRSHMDFNLDNSNRSKRRLYESWGSPYLDSNLDAKMPKAEFNDAGSMEWSSYFMEDGSYLRMESLMIGYNLAKIIRVKSVRNLQIYGQVSNVFTITSYTGLDPEVSESGMSYGIDYGSWPMQRKFIIGVTIGF